MSSAAKKRYTVEEFYELEARSLVKHQYFNGRIFLLHPPDETGMAGASATHNLIIGNVVASAKGALRGKGCRVFPSDMQVKCPSDLRTYPDVTMLCGTAEYEGDKELALLNPQVIVEVLSPSSERYDRGEKFTNYQTITTLQEYVLVAADRPMVHHYQRQAEKGQWLLTMLQGLDATLELPTLGISLSLEQVYEEIDLPSDVPLLNVGEYDPESDPQLIPRDG